MSVRRRLHRVLWAFVAVATLTAGFASASAQRMVQSPAPPASASSPESCPGLVAQYRPPVTPASFRVGAPRPFAWHLAALARDEVRLTFVGHATFLIESPGGVRIATDYNDYVRPRVVPDIATMNHAHTTHYTLSPDPAIRHVLRGWAENEKPARIDVNVGDVHVRNVPTNIRRWGGDTTERQNTERHGNSIFIFEIGSLCVAHLGHLHHTLTPQQLAEIGRVDVVLVPVDGSYTLDLDGMVEVLQGLKAPLMIPMHFFSGFTLNNFLTRLATLNWTVERAELPTVVVSRATLPPTPKILVLPGR